MWVTKLDMSDKLTADVVDRPPCEFDNETLYAVSGQTELAVGMVIGVSHHGSNGL